MSGKNYTCTGYALLYREEVYGSVPPSFRPRSMVAMCAGVALMAGLAGVGWKHEFVKPDTNDPETP